jgi:diguanylate cyclase (GGDEF)-like protein
MATDAPPPTMPERVPQHDLLARIAALAQLGGIEWHPREPELAWNDESCRLHGVAPRASVAIDDWLALYDPDGAQRVREALDRLREGESAFERVEMNLARAPDATLPALRLSLHREPEAGPVERNTGEFQELRSEHAPARGDTLAHTDILTGLCNRRGLLARGAAAVEHAQRSERPLALLFLDLDHFKRINDTLGHQAGDEVLREVARRLDASVRGSDVVARQSGDEFVVVLSEVNRPQDAALVAQKVLDSLARPITVLDQPVQVGCSIGLALLGENATDLAALMRAADTAMYAAKQSGRNAFRFYSEALDQRQQRRSEREQELRRALSRQELSCVYQPTVRLADGRIGSIETLLRWRGPDGELRQPADFLPLAEDSGEIVPIGHWVLRECCTQARRWSEEGLNFERVTINLSAQQLRDETLLPELDAVLADTGWPASRLEFDVTETALMHDRDASRRVLVGLHARGAHVAVDDFGTSFSNLIYLHRVQVQALKLDRHFALGMPDDPALQELSAALIAMGHSLRLRLVAKGVETEFAATYLGERGCDEAQGFHFARPMPAADVTLWWQARELSQRALRLVNP